MKRFLRSLAFCFVAFANTEMGIGMPSFSDLKTWQKGKPVFDPAPEWAKDPVPAYPGHTCAPDIIKAGDRWLFAAHGYDMEKAGASKLVVRDLQWDSEGCPTFE